MKALRFGRKPARFAAAAVASRVVPGSGASVGPLTLADVDEPDLPTGEWVRLRPLLAGICGSDLATIDGRSSRYFEPIVTLPFTPGHEVVGCLDDDRRVVLVPVLSCATRGIAPPCRACAEGRTNHCGRIAFGHLDAGLQSGFCAATGGGWSTSMVAHPTQLVDVPEALSDEGAVLVEPTACAVHAADRAVQALAAIAAGRPSAGPARVGVIGSGTLGLLTIAALRAHGEASDAIGMLVATAKHPHQRGLARALGADRVVAPRELGGLVRSLTGAFVLDGGQLTDGVELVVDCVGSDASLAQALQVVAPGGEVLVVGMPGHTTLDLTPLWHRETAVRGCYAYSRDDFDRAIALVADAGLDRLVSATYPLSRYRDAVAHAADAGARGGVKIAFDLRPARQERS